MRSFETFARSFVRRIPAFPFKTTEKLRYSIEKTQEDKFYLFCSYFKLCTIEKQIFLTSEATDCER